MPRPNVRGLYDGLEAEPGLGERDLQRLVRVHRQRTRPLVIRWAIDGGFLAALYGLGYAGAYLYWLALQMLWGPEYVFIFAPLGHAIPAFVVGIQTGVLFSRGRYFFLCGPLVVLAAIFVRQVWIPWGDPDALGHPIWLYWALCAEATVAATCALALGAWLGAHV